MMSHKSIKTHLLPVVLQFFMLLLSPPPPSLPSGSAPLSIHLSTFPLCPFSLLFLQTLFKIGSSAALRLLSSSSQTLREKMSIWRARRKGKMSVTSSFLSEHSEGVSASTARPSVDRFLHHLLDLPLV